MKSNVTDIGAYRLARQMRRVHAAEREAIDRIMQGPLATPNVSREALRDYIETQHRRLLSTVYDDEP